MTHIGDSLNICYPIDVQDDAIALPLFGRLLAGEYSDELWSRYEAATKRVWRVESFRQGLTLFRPFLRAEHLWDDFDTEAEAQAFMAELETQTTPMSPAERLHAWVRELKRSVRECVGWLRWRSRRFWQSQLDKLLG